MPAAAKKSAGRRAPAKAGKPATTKKATAKKQSSAAGATKAAPKKAAPAKAPAKKAVAKKAAKAVAKKAATPKKVVAKATPAKATGAKATPAKATGAKATGARKKTVICELSGFEVMPSPQNLSPKTLERLRQKLVDERTRLLHQADELAAEAEQLARDREAGDTQFDEESGEGDTVNIERERDLLLSSQARQVVEAIETALTRMKRGTYGVCRYAGRKISLERLEAIPWADVCVECKARAERRR